MFNTVKHVPKTLPWSERVERSASSANAKFGSLQIEDDFIAEGRKAFGEYLSNHEKRGGQVEEVMWFVWYLVGPADGH